MPLFENGRDIQFQNSTFTDVGRDNHVHYGTKQTALSMLKSQVAAGAFHNSKERSEHFDPPKCHPGTRIAVLDKIRDWYKNEETAAPRIMWLYGPAGAGKSAIAQTIAEECHKLRTLAASFFFSRTAPGRNDATHLIATIAYQIAQDIPETRLLIQQALENDPMIFLKSLETQLDQLVTKPLLDILSNNSLSSEFWPKLLIIDGLDECDNGKTQQAIVHCLASALTTLPLRVLILSRPEQPIRESFSHSDRRGTYISLVLDNEYKPDEDIALFLRESFDVIRQTHILKSHIPKKWPSAVDIRALVQKSSGQFIFAATIMRYVESPRHRPIDRLQNILGIGNHKDATPFAQLDALYMHILQSVDEAQHATILRVFGFLLCGYSSLEASEIEEFLNIPSGDIDLALADCHSIVNLSHFSLGLSHPRSRLRFFHASISDFLVDPARSQGFFVDNGMTHAGLARACMRGVCSSREDIRSYSSMNLTKHCESAYMDKVLLEDLLRFDLSNLFHPNGDHFSDHTPWLLYGSCLKQISYVKKQVHGGLFDIPKDSLDHQLMTLDHYIRRQLLTFMWPPDRVAKLLALADKIQPTYRLHYNDYWGSIGPPDTWKHAGHLLDLNVFDAYIGTPSTRHFIRCTSFMHEETMGIEQLYLDFFRDRERAGKYHINPEVYAHIALQCIAYVCGEPYKGDIQGQNVYESEKKDYESEANCNPVTCKIGLAALPSIISSAAPMEKLADNLRSGKSSQWVEIRVARVEYLERYDSWEKQRYKSNQEVEENPRAAELPRGQSESPKKRSLTKKPVRDEGQQGKLITRGGVLGWCTARFSGALENMRR